MAERSAVERRWVGVGGGGLVVMRNGPGGEMIRLWIDRSKSAAVKREWRSDGSRRRESVWDLRNPNGRESYAEETGAEAKNRDRRENGVVCDVGHATQTIGGIAGKRSREVATQSMRRNGEVDIPNPESGRLGGLNRSRSDGPMSLQ